MTDPALLRVSAPLDARFDAVPRIENGKGALPLGGGTAGEAPQMKETELDRAVERLSDIAAFVRSMALLLASQSTYSVSTLTVVVGRYTHWAQQVRGLPLAERLIFDTQVIDIYLRDAARDRKLAKSTIRTYRSILLRASEVLLPRDNATPTRGSSRSELLRPYTALELEEFPLWARVQGTDLKRDKALALMCLGLGCGLRAGEINALRRRDIDDEGVVTVRTGERTRRVPMLPGYLRQIAPLLDRRAGDDFVFGRPQRSINPNAISEFISESGTRRVQPNTYRMRSTWIVGRLNAGADLPTLLQAADLSRLEKLVDYIPYLPSPTTESFAKLATEVRQ